MARSTTPKQSPASADAVVGLCFRFMCWHPEAEDHAREMVLCYRCQHSLAWGCDVRKQPRKKTGPGKRKGDPDVVLGPVPLPCQMCAANGWEPVYEADVMEQRRREHEEELAAGRRLQPAEAVHTPNPPDDDGQVNLF